MKKIPKNTNEEQKHWIDWGYKVGYQDGLVAAVNLIAKGEGWEDSRDHYLKETEKLFDYIFDDNSQSKE